MIRPRHPPERAGRPSGRAPRRLASGRDRRRPPGHPRLARPALARRRARHGRGRDGRLPDHGLVDRRRRVHDRDHPDDGRLQGGPRARWARPGVDGPRRGRGRRHHLRHGRDRRRGGPVGGGQRTSGGEAHDPDDRGPDRPPDPVRLRAGRVDRGARARPRRGAVRRGRHQPASLDAARADGHLVVAGDATIDAVLREAGIERARGLITTIDSDANNVYVTLSARSLNPNLFVVARANQEGSEAKLVQAGADRVVSPYTRAGRQIAELAIRPGVADFIDFALSHGEPTFTIEAVEVRPGGPLDGQAVGALRDRGIFSLAVARGDRDYRAQPGRPSASCARASTSSCPVSAGDPSRVARARVSERGRAASAAVALLPGLDVSAAVGDLPWRRSSADGDLGPPPCSVVARRDHRFAVRDRPGSRTRVPRPR